MKDNVNNVIDEATINLINKVVGSAEEAADFLSGQIPDYIMQLLVWHGWYNFFLFATALVMWGGSLLFLHHINKPIWKEYFDREETRLLPLFSTKRQPGVVVLYGIGGSFLAGILSFSACFMINIEWLKIWLAPKVWLVEYATQLVK